MFARLHCHPTAGLRFAKVFDSVREALEYQDLEPLDAPEGKPPEVYEVLVVELAGYMTGGETAETATLGGTAPKEAKAPSSKKT